MASRLFSDDQLEALKGFPDIDKDELIRFFTLTPADVAFVDPGRGRGPAVKELEEFLLGRAMEHDSPTTLFTLACEYLVAARRVRPGAVTAASVKTAIEKLKFLRAMDAHVLDLSMLAAERRRFPGHGRAAQHQPGPRAARGWAQVIRSC